MGARGVSLPEIDTKLANYPRLYAAPTLGNKTVAPSALKHQTRRVHHIEHIHYILFFSTLSLLYIEAERDWLPNLTDYGKLDKYYLGNVSLYQSTSFKDDVKFNSNHCTGKRGCVKYLGLMVDKNLTGKNIQLINFIK